MKIPFEIMLYGMAGIFAATLLIMSVTYILKRLDTLSQNKTDREK